jgi:hypothetical protein
MQSCINPRAALLALLATVLLAWPVHAQSTINPRIPAANSTLSSAPIRGNFQAAYNDINGLYASFLNPLAMPFGGTGAALTPSNGGIVYSNASSLAILTGTSTARHMLQSGASTTPAWSTATWPATAAQGTVLNAGTLNAWSATATPTLGQAGVTTGCLSFGGVTSGTASVCAQSAAGAPALLWPTTSGTLINTAGGQSIAGLTVTGSLAAPGGTVSGTTTFTYDGDWWIGGNTDLSLMYIGGFATASGTLAGLLTGGDFCHLYFNHNVPTPSNGTFTTTADYTSPSYSICWSDLGLLNVYQAPATGVLGNPPAFGATPTYSQNLLTGTLKLNGVSVPMPSAATTWTAVQTFTNSDIRLLGSSTGYTAFTSANAGGSSYTLTFPAVTDTLATLGTADQTLSGGANLTAYSIGTKSGGTYTVDCGFNPVQYLLNAGAFIIAAPALDGHCVVQAVSGPGAGVITLSGFSASASGTGDIYTTANTASGAVTISNNSPAVITWTQAFVPGQVVYFTTSSALPAGITANQIYYVIAAGLSGSSFEISATPGGAAVNTSSAGSGTQTGHEPAVYALYVFRVNGLATGVWKQQQ